MSNASTGFSTAKFMDLSAIDTSAFNEPIANKYLGVGTYAGSKLVGITFEDYGYGPTLLLSWKAPEGGEIRQFVRVKYEAPAKEGEEKKKPILTKEYIKFSRLAVNDAEAAFRAQFFLQMAPSNPKLFEGLKGIEATVVVGPARKGVEVVQKGDGSYVVMDVKTGELAKILADQSFMTMEEAANEIKQKDLRRAFPEVYETTATAEEVERNEKSLRNYIAQATSPENTAVVQRLNAF